MFTLKIEKPNLNPYTPRQMNADVYCGCCGRGIPDRWTCHVVRVGPKKTAEGETIMHHIPADWRERDPVEWGTFIGSHCQKRIPKTHKLSMKRAMKFYDTWA